MAEEQIPEAWVGQVVYCIVSGMGEHGEPQGRMAPLVAVREAGIVLRETVGGELQDAFYPWGNVVRLTLQPQEVPPEVFSED